MTESILKRRAILQAVSGAFAACAVGDSKPLQQNRPITVPWSAGASPPVTKAPPLATDCHLHIYEPQFPFAPSAVLKPGPATVADYRLLQKRLGLTRCVVVQPSSYGIDNRCLLSALKQFGASTARGIAVVNTTVTERELNTLNAAGVKGIRFNLLQAGATTLDMLEDLSKRVAALEWHVQINASPDQIAGAHFLWERLPCPVVFDHFAHIVPAGRQDSAFPVVVKLLKSGKGWLKLSGAYIDSKQAGYTDTIPIAKAYVQEAPDQLVWGTDWPHPTEQQKPDDALLFDLLAQSVPDEGTRSKILVSNPARLYGFASTGEK